MKQQKRSDEDRMLEERIRQFTVTHDCIIGICDALPLEEERERLMAVTTPFVSLDIEKRINPSRSLPGAKSVIVLGKGYTPSAISNLSSLGYGTDYHFTLTRILKKLAQYLNCNNVIMVDSGPLAERAFAVKAGLGFWGRNGMVISPKLGSFFNIGLMIVDIVLIPTPALSTNRLKSACPEDCRKCIDACPNGAIKAYSVDSMTCASYITQKKGGLTEAEMAAMGTQLYGCDFCQVCCPMNKVSSTAKTSQLDQEDPEAILAMDEAAFKMRFGHTAMAWRGLKHLQRNAKIVLGNTQVSK